MVHWLKQIHSAVWGPCTLILFLGTGLWFTVRSGFFQVRGLRMWWKKTAGVWWNTGEKEGKVHKISQVQSACTALAATIGTGNIVGVATALTAGGPGALFWMWISAGIGMMTAYAETWLGIRYRYRLEGGRWMCGPMVYMERGLRCPILGKIYAGLIILVSLGMGSMVQANSLSEAVQPWIETLGNGLFDEKMMVGIAVVILIGSILIGGIHRITRVTERLVPISAGLYLLFSIAVIFSCWRKLPGIFGLIFQEAWKPMAAGGGLSGFLINSSVQYGLSRGVFSNEAGLGSLAILHGNAEETTPEEQGMWAMFEVCFDTIIICTLTALVVLCETDCLSVPLGLDGAVLTEWCFSQRLGFLGKLFVSGALVVFAFATIIAWYYLGEQAVGYLTDGNLHQWTRWYLFLYLSAVFFGCMGRIELIWMLSDIWNGLLAFPNLLALWMLEKKVLFPKKSFTAP
ncbi:MAG: alanine/glycine:cation symporter family protein [Brotaphodocola sp.]